MYIEHWQCTLIEFRVNSAFTKKNDFMMIINVSEKMSGKRKQSTLSQSSESESEPETQQKKSKLGNLRYLYVIYIVSWWILPALYYEKHGERERGKKKRFRGRGLPFPPPPAVGAGFIPPAPSLCEGEKMYLKGGGGDRYVQNVPPRFIYVSCIYRFL